MRLPKKRQRKKTTFPLLWDKEHRILDQKLLIAWVNSVEIRIEKLERGD